MKPAWFVPHVPNVPQKMLLQPLYPCDHKWAPKAFVWKGWANGPGTSNSEARPVGPEQDSDKGVFVIQSHGLSENLSENRVHIFIHWSIIILPVKM